MIMVTLIPELPTVLRSLRENTELSQREFSDLIGFDQSRVSRLESGSMVSTEEDVEKWLGASVPEDAARVRTWLRTPWQVVSDVPPTWNHPDLRALAVAAEAIKRLNDHVPESLRPSADRYREDLLVAFGALRNLTYRATLVGGTAVGKSTAEAHGLELLTPRGESVLPTGGGSTTLCEVFIETGDRWGLIVEPEHDDEIRRLVEDLCAVVQPEPSRPEDERPTLPSEVRIALLNMAGLGPKNDIGTDGQTVRREPIRDLAAAEGKRLLSSLLIRLRMPERQRTEFWWDQGIGSEPMSWLRENLRRINRGLHPEVSLPRRLRLILARPVIPEGPFAITVVDTRGVTDNIVRRPDLASSLADTRTVIVLCSSFLNAPDLYVRNLIQYADEQEFSAWRARTALLLLARPTEPAQVRYEDSDELVDTPEDGIRIKEANAQQQLAEPNQPDVKVATYNALNDEPAWFRSMVLDRILAARVEQKELLTALVSACGEMLETAKAQALERGRIAIGHAVLPILGELEDLPRGSTKPQEVLLHELGIAHARSVWAMSRRQGQWRTLSLDLHLSDGAAQVARASGRDPIDKLIGMLDLMTDTTELKDAQALIRQFGDAVEKARVDFIAQARIAAQATIWSPMHADLRLWADCESEWGRGAGFRNRVVSRMRTWFAEHEPCLDDFFVRLNSAWLDRFIAPLRRLSSPSDGSHDRGVLNVTQANMLVP